MKRIALFLSLFVIIWSMTGCQKPQEKKDYNKQLEPGQQALRKITDPEKIPDFTVACLTLSDLREGIDNSLNYLSKPSSRNFFPSGQVTHAMVINSLEEFASLLDQGLIGAELNQTIRQKFDVYKSVGCDNEGTVLFTGYYTPIFNGSWERTERFKYPLYKKPDDLVKAQDGTIMGRRTASGGLEAYPPRRELENSGILEGNELIWLEDPFEVYIAHVQGSAKIRLPDGELVTVGYAANNGYEYKSISKKLVADGVLSEDQLSLSAMIEFFDNHQGMVDQYVDQNPRFVFFQQQEGPPRGSLNEPVIPYRTIATDKSIFPRASLTFISTKLPRSMGGSVSIDYYSGFALDQDTGGAIRAPGRCDVYIGQGDEAGKLAGMTYQEGKLYYLFLKSSDNPDMLALD